jgi:hypothetical protein
VPEADEKVTGLYKMEYDNQSFIPIVLETLPVFNVNLGVGPAGNPRKVRSNGRTGE